MEEGKTDVLSGPSYQLVYTQATASNLESLHNRFYLILFSLRSSLRLLHGVFAISTPSCPTALLQRL